MPRLNTLIIYARNMQRSAQFYHQHFDFETTGEIIERLIELKSKSGINILIHQAAKSVKLGQATIKLSFDVQNIEQFITQSEQQGLILGAIHHANGYCFANTKDPDGNSVSISSRTFRNISN
ncbi:VOC family protein [Acinetobacter puyangensis]|uniref:VOC family protein n=1 Tax=Acinetobacter puyangensis TaxID=1096779 RepID=UPI003A4E22BC